MSYDYEVHSHRHIAYIINIPFSSIQLRITIIIWFPIEEIPFYSNINKHPFKVHKIVLEAASQPVRQQCRSVWREFVWVNGSVFECPIYSTAGIDVCERLNRTVSCVKWTPYSFQLIVYKYRLFELREEVSLLVFFSYVDVVVGNFHKILPLPSGWQYIDMMTRYKDTYFPNFMNEISL